MHFLFHLHLLSMRNLCKIIEIVFALSCGCKQTAGTKGKRKPRACLRLGLAKFDTTCEYDMNSIRFLRI